MSAEEYSALQIRAGDGDGDGYADDSLAFGDDCDDADPAVNPGAVEIAYNGVDDDCDPRTPDDDLDLDGVESADDCDDSDAGRSPELTELWYDGVDQDCDGNDTDQDGDGEAWVEAGGQDCDDTDPSVQMRSWYVDGDRDGYGDQKDPLDQCEAVEGRQELGGDCDDRDPQVSPGALEICNDGVDNDCSGDAPECQVQSGELSDAAIYLWEGESPGDGFGADHAVADVDGDGVVEVLIGAQNTGCLYFGDELALESWCPGSAGGLVASATDLDGDGLDEVVTGIPYGDLRVQSGERLLSGEPVNYPPIDTPDVVYWIDLQPLDAEPDAGRFVTLQVGQEVQDFVTSYDYIDGRWERPWLSYFDRGTEGSSHLETGDFEGDGTAQVVVSLQRSDDVRQVFVWSPVNGGFGGLETADLEIGARSEAVDGLASSDVNGDGYADLLVSTVLSPDESSLFVLLGPELAFELGAGAATIHGGGLQLGEDICVARVQSTGEPRLVVAKPDGLADGSAGGIYGLEVPTVGVSTLDESLWALSSAAGRPGSKVTCVDDPSLDRAFVLVSQDVAAESSAGQVFLLPLDGL